MRSRSPRKAKRAKDDAYFTPQKLALAMVEALAGWWPLDPYEVIEPSCGSGAFIAAARTVWPKALIIAVDANDHEKDALRAGADAFVRGRWQDVALRMAPTPGERRVILGNPPYSEAEAHVRASLAALNTGDVLAYLLRLSFLGASEREALWRTLPCASVQTVMPRPSFGLNRHGKKGTDGSEYASYAWMKGSTGATILRPPLVWRSPRSRRSP